MDIVELNNSTHLRTSASISAQNTSVSLPSKVLSGGSNRPSEVNYGDAVETCSLLILDQNTFEG